MAFADVLAGFGEAAQQQHQNLLEMQYGMRKQTADYFGKLADDPRYDEASQRAFAQKGIEILTGDPMKPLSPKDLDMSKVQVQPPTPPGGQGTPQQSNLPMPQAGPLPTSATTAVAPPGPPPTHPADQLMPFEQQMSRLGQEAQAKAQGQYGIATLKASIPQKVDAINVQGADGLRYKEEIYHRLNPATGQVEEFHIKQDQPLAFFAPRSGAENTVANLKKWQAESGSPIKDSSGQPLDLSKFSDDAVLQHIGEDRYVPVSPKQTLADVGGYRAPFNPISATVGAPVGLAQASLPKTREATVPMPGGKLGKTSLTTTTGVQAPVAPSFVPGSPIPAFGTQAAAPQAPPQQAPGAVTGAVPAPQSAPQPQAKVAAPVAPKGGTVTPLPGAGHGLTANQMQENRESAAAFDNMVDRMIDVVQRAPLLNDLWKAGKISLAVDPQKPWHLVASRMSGLTPEEATFAANYISLGEDINLLRGVMKATGFRGPEAFATQQAQRGPLLGDPQVFQKTLKNTLKASLDQMGAINSTMADNGAPLPLTPAVMKAYMYLNDNNAKSAADQIRKAKWAQ